MKRIIATALAVTMLFLFAVVSNASDFMNIEPDGSDENGYYTPGTNFYFKIYDGGYQMQSDILDFFHFKINLLQGKGYVQTCKIVEKSDGYAYLNFMAKPGFAYRTPVIVEIEVKAIDNKDEDNVYTQTLQLDVGYGDETYVSTDTLEVDLKTPLVEFDEDLETCNISFGDLATFNVRLGKKKTYNLHYSSTVNTEVQNANPTANITFMNFTTKPVFDYAGALKIYAPGAKYLYTVDSYNDLTSVSAARNGDYLGLSTNALEHYVASDIPLKASSQVASSTSASSSSSTVATSSTVASVSTSQSSSTSTVTNTTVKPNPATGAAQ